jgi:hypothetical protein
MRRKLRKKTGFGQSLHNFTKRGFDWGPMEFGVCCTAEATPSLCSVSTPSGHGTVVPAPTEAFPLRTDLRQIIRPNKAGAASIPPMNHNDVGVRQGCLWVSEECSHRRLRCHGERLDVPELS